MSDFYDDDGSLVVISILKPGSTYPSQRAYAVAEKDHGEARKIVEDGLPDEEPVIAVTALPAAVMKELKLSSGEYTGWPEVRR